MNKTDAVNFLLDHGASPTNLDLFGRSPLDEARLLGHTAVCKLLERATPREHNKDQNQNTSSKC